MPSHAPALRLHPGGLTPRLGSLAPSRALAAVACQLSICAAGFLYLNRTLTGDVYFLLASGRHLVETGWVERSPFRTLAEGRVWHNQQWLAEWAFYGVHQAGGLSLVSLLYALLLAASVAPLAWLCRERPPLLVAGAWALAVHSLVAVLDPRAAGFSIALFGALITLLEASRRRPLVLLALPALFALWANLHGAFPAGLLLLAVAALAAALTRSPDGRRRVELRPALPLLAALAASCLALFVTPLGLGIVDYLRAYDEHIAPNRLPFEWQATHRHPVVLALVAAFALFAARLWAKAPRPRPLGPVLIAGAFVLFALTATRQVVWLGPLAFMLVHRLGPATEVALPRRFAVPLAAGGLALLAGWWGLVGPAPNGAPQVTAAAREALAHPPRKGRLVVPSGTGSYVLWRDPDRAITIDGRLELYTARQVIANYRLLNGQGALRYLRRWRIGGVVTRDRRGVRVLRRHGFRVAARRGEGWYLVRRSGRRGAQSFEPVLRRPRRGPPSAVNAS